MALSPGTRLGPYEILIAIGSGGMGDVYKARDTRLDRAVALKVIQPAVAASPEIRERFEREARAISALDHPHICMLYDVCREPAVIGGASGASGTGESVSFLVMQYLEGETLADRLARAGKPASDPSRPSSGSSSTTSAISRGPIPFETTLRFAAEIAQALDAAHRRGIVHRDLKPGNVMLTKAGTKLLDFGLAKLAENENAAGVGFGDGATRTSPLTSQGAILGTLHYMSPEQLEGREVDARSDIHAFGAVLFEMLCGRRAFEGQSQASIIAAIIGTDPPSLTALADARTTLPMVAQRALDRLLAKCLAKNPDDRWQSAADLAAELQWINEERLRAASEPAGVAPAIGPAVDQGSRRRERVWMAVAAGAIVALAGLAYWWYPRAAPPPEPIAFTIEAPAGQSMAVGPGLLSVSPDGRRVAFVTGAQPGQLWVRTLGSLESKRLERADAAWHPVWSPDGKSIAFVGPGGSAALRKIDLATGVPTTLAPAATGRVAWGKAGVILFESGNKLYRVSDTGGGSPAVAMELDASRQDTNLNWPVFLPDGRHYVFVARSSDPSKSGLFLATLDAPERTFLLNTTSNVDYSSGFLFYQREGTLVAHPFDADAGRLIGDPMTVMENVRYNAGNGRGAFSVSESGVLAFVAGTDTTTLNDRKVMLFDRSGKSAKQIGTPRAYVAATLSPDGRQAVVGEDTTSEPAVRMLSLMDMQRGVLTRFTTGSDDERNPVWSRDGSSVVFQSRRGDTYGVYRRSAGGGATKDELLLSSAEPVAPTGFSSDDKLLLITRGGAANQRIWVLPMTGDRKPIEAFPGATAAQFSAVFSPDDKWIAYVEGRSPTDAEVYIQPYPADDRRIRISPSSGRYPHWVPDGRHIVYRSSDNTLRSVELRPDGRTFRVSDPVTLFTERRASRTNWYFSADARVEKFLLVVPPDQAETQTAPPPITVMVNFTQGLGRK